MEGYNLSPAHDTGSLARSKTLTARAKNIKHDRGKLHDRTESWWLIIIITVLVRHIRKETNRRAKEKYDVNAHNNAQH